MRPRDTKYLVARCPQDYRKAHAFLQEDVRLTRPTILAMRDGKVIGVLGTQRKGKMWPVAGPLKTSSPIITMRLLDTYDRLLGAIGGKHYWFSVQQDTMWYGTVLKFMDKTGAITPLGEKNGETWFRRDLAA